MARRKSKKGGGGGGVAASGEISGPEPRFVIAKRDDDRVKRRRRQRTFIKARVAREMQELRGFEQPLVVKSQFTRSKEEYPTAAPCPLSDHMVQRKSKRARTMRI